MCHVAARCGKHWLAIAFYQFAMFYHLWSFFSRSFTFRRAFGLFICITFAKYVQCVFKFINRLSSHSVTKIFSFLNLFLVICIDVRRYKTPFHLPIVELTVLWTREFLSHVLDLLIKASYCQCSLNACTSYLSVILKTNSLGYTKKISAKHWSQILSRIVWIDTMDLYSNSFIYLFYSLFQHKYIY